MKLGQKQPAALGYRWRKYVRVDVFTLEVNKAKGIEKLNNDERLANFLQLVQKRWLICPTV